MEEKGLDVTAATMTETEQASKVSIKCFKSIFILENADSKRFITLFSDLRKDMIKKHNNFPKTVVEMFDMLNRWKPEGNWRTLGSPSNQHRRRHIGHTYTQTTGPLQGTELVLGCDGTTSNVLCYGCQNWEHICPNCLNQQGRIGRSLMQFGFCLMQWMNNEIQSNGAIDCAWIVLGLCLILIQQSVAFVIVHC